jgi:hypothetical protein
MGRPAARLGDATTQGSTLLSAAGMTVLIGGKPHGGLPASTCAKSRTPRHPSRMVHLMDLELRIQAQAPC